MEQGEKTADPREVRDHINLTAFGMILYSLTTLLFVLPSEFLSDGRFYWHLATLGAVAGVAVLFFLYRRTMSVPVLFARSGREMTPPAFLLFLIVFFSAQMTSTLLELGLEALLNALGLSMESSLVYATLTSTSPMMLFYAAVVAPVAEELVYRGFCLRLTQRFGKVFAIVFSAFAFAVMHENLPQAVFAFQAGLVLGFVTLRYSLHWAILMHFINNFVLGDLADTLCAFLPENAQALLYYLFFGMMLISAVFVMSAKRGMLGAWLQENRAEKGTYRYALTALLMIVLILMHLVPALLLLDIL
ncbi:MAG: CPBP family intramembrane metalloprotease [Lachnospiraceae bacterium]|nr:CPBP family intramembrane metalloprotease [Lachnospiraceae bacterium]